MRRARHAAIALSLANLCFLREWAVILKPSNWFDINGAMIPMHLIALVLNVLILAAGFFAGAMIGGDSRRPGAAKAARWAFLGALIVVLNVARELAGPGLLDFLYLWDWRLLFKYERSVVAARFAAYALVLLGLFRWRNAFLRLAGILSFLALTLHSFVPEVALFVGLAFLIVCKYQRQAVSLAAQAYLILSPFVLVTFSQAIGGIAETHSLMESRSFVKPALAIEPPKTRVVWLVFDEMDQSIAFAHRPRSLVLPELDRLRAESFYASDAYSPSTMTVLSLPALLTGQPIRESRPVGVGDVSIVLERTGETVSLSSQPNVFSAAHDAGYIAASVTGGSNWFRPFQRYTLQSNNDNLIQTNPYAEIARLMAYQSYHLLPLWNTPRQEALTNQLSNESSVIQYRQSLYAAKEKAQDPRIGFLFLYFSVPHPPRMYDRSIHDFVYDVEFSDDGYLDNLALVDRTLGEIRRAMEEAGAWEKTAVILTSDHHWRSSKGFQGVIKEKWVPFLVKFPGQKEGVVYEHPFKTLLTHDLVIAILHGEVSRPSQCARWLDQRSDGAFARPGP